MPYLKTTWADDITPISATNMNHIEQGIVNVETNLENLAYDLYSIWLQEYYSSYFVADPPTIDGTTKAIIINGFKSAAEYNIALTDAAVVVGSTFSERVKCVPPAWTKQRSISCVNHPSSGMLGVDSFDWLNPQDAADDNDSTAATSSMTVEGYEYGTLLFDLGSIKSIEHFEVILSTNTEQYEVDEFSSEIVYDAKFSADGTNFYTTNMFNTSTTYRRSASHLLTFNTPTNVRYMVVQVRTRQDGPGSSTHYVYEGRGLNRTDLFIPSTLISNVKTLSFSPSKIVGYFSDNIPSGSDVEYYVSTDGGSVWTLGEFVSSIPDVKVVTCIEREIHFNNLPSGTQLAIKAVLTPTTGMSGVTPAISRYGLFLYEV